MMTPADESNPYEAPTHLGHETPATRWRLAPTIFVGALGTVVLLVGLAMMGMFAWFLVTSPSEVISYAFAETEQVIKPLGVAISTCAIGVTWIGAAKKFWKKRYQRGLLLFVVGFILMIVTVMAV